MRVPQQAKTTARTIQNFCARVVDNKPLSHAGLLIFSSLIARAQKASVHLREEFT